MTNKKDYVEITIRLPKGVVDFIKDFEGDGTVEEKVTRSMIELVFSAMETVDQEMLIEKYSLKDVFREYGELPNHREEAEEQPNLKVETRGSLLSSDSATLQHQIWVSRDVYDKLKVKATAKGMDVDEYVAKEIIEKRLKEMPELE